MIRFAKVDSEWVESWGGEKGPRDVTWEEYTMKCLKWSMFYLWVNNRKTSTTLRAIHFYHQHENIGLKIFSVFCLTVKLLQPRREVYLYHHPPSPSHNPRRLKPSSWCHSKVSRYAFHICPPTLNFIKHNHHHHLSITLKKRHYLHCSEWLADIRRQFSNNS